MPSVSNTKRVKGCSIYRPIVYGNIAHPFHPDKKPPHVPEDHTHQWTVSVGGVNGADISHFIKKVQIKLHADTYSNPTRNIETPPFEVTETGWGEFEIQMKIFFHPESNEKPQTLFHYLKLHPYIGSEAEQEMARQHRLPVSAYSYDECVFNEPTEAMYEILTSKGTVQLPSRARGVNTEFTVETEAVELDRLGEGIRIVLDHVKKTKEQVLEREKQVAELRAALENR